MSHYSVALTVKNPDTGTIKAREPKTVQASEAWMAQHLEKQHLEATTNLRVIGSQTQLVSWE